MNPAALRRTLLGALCLLALGGLLLHLRIHPFSVPDKVHPGGSIFRGPFLAASLLPLLDVLVVTALFAFKRTAVYGFLLNGLLVIYGSVVMGHYAMAMLGPRDPSLVDWVLKSTLPDIGIAWADFFVGKALYDSWLHER